MDKKSTSLFTIDKAFKNDFSAYLENRVLVAHSSFLGTETYKDLSAKQDSLFKEIHQKMGGDKESWRMIDALEGVHGRLAWYYSERCYIQGLQDGRKLQDLLNKGIPEFYTDEVEAVEG